jgi:hypothetical protein
MQIAASALGRLLHEISWEGNARKYRHGGRGLENVLTVEVFQALDFLPRTEFLGRIIRSAVAGSPATLRILAEQVEDLAFSLLPGDIDLAEDPPKGKGRLNLQPDGILQSKLVYCMLEAKRIKRGAFMPEQLAREFLAVVREAGDRNGLLFLVLPAPPPIHVRGHGRLALHDAVALCLPRVLERTDGQFPSISELCSIIDSTVGYTTWPRIEEEVEGALEKFPCEDPSVRGSISRLGHAVINAIRRHGHQPGDSLKPDLVPCLPAR